MGNVVSSLVMYALQAAWFCQRLIDQDYRENHGSRSKPIMGINETDLDVFLSKCRTYYLSKRNRNRPIKYEEEGPKRKLNHLNREANYLLEGADSAWSKGADSLHFDNDNFLSRTDQQVSLSEPDLSRLIIDKNDLDYFLSKSMELPRGQRKSDSPRTERRKRKKVYYRKRYNPRGGDRTTDTHFAVSNSVNYDLLLTADTDDTDFGSWDDSSGFKFGWLVSQQRTRESLNVNTSLEHPNRCDVEKPPLPDHCYSLPRSFLPPSPPAQHDLVVLIEKADSDRLNPGCSNDVDRVLHGMDHEVLKMMIPRECLTGSPFYYDL